MLEGIWAAAPYLHNGSVPTLAELLKPPAQRKTTFSLGAKYDIENLGLAETQDPSIPPRTVTGCDKLNSGNSNCGHDFGTGLSDPDKKALLEYLKTSLKRDETRLNSHRALALCLSMIFAENRYTLFRIML